MTKKKYPVMGVRVFGGSDKVEFEGTELRDTKLERDARGGGQGVVFWAFVKQDQAKLYTLSRVLHEDCGVVPSGSRDGEASITTGSEGRTVRDPETNFTSRFDVT